MYNYHGAFAGVNSSTINAVSKRMCQIKYQNIKKQNSSGKFNKNNSVTIQWSTYHIFRESPTYTS